MKHQSWPRWIVQTPIKVNGSHWHVLYTRKQMRDFANQHNGKRKELRDTH